MLGLALAGGRSLWAAVRTPAVSPTMTIYMSPTCGCCAKWVDHVKAAGFTTVVHEDEDMDVVKESLGVPGDMRSCHTAQVDKYLIEGHVPAEDIKKLLDQKPRPPAWPHPACRPARPAWPCPVSRTRRTTSSSSSATEARRFSQTASEQGPGHDRRKTE